MQPIIHQTNANVEPVPDNVTTWEWLFESKDTSPLHLVGDKPLGAFIDAESGQRLDWAEVKSKSTALSTCLTRHYNLRPDDTVTVFSGNSIWYPLCLFAILRAGVFIEWFLRSYAELFQVQESMVLLQHALWMKWFTL